MSPPGRGAGSFGGRAGLLRRLADERQRREGAGRRHAPWHRSRARADGPGQRHHRLDRPRERQGSAARPGEAHPAEARLPAGQAGECDPDCPRTGGGVVGCLGSTVIGEEGASRMAAAAYYKVGGTD